MKRKKFSEIISKEDRNEFLKYLMEKEVEKIRKKTYKYKRCNVICYPITIEETEFKDNTTLGQYVWDEESKLHKIYIASRLIDNYILEYYYKYLPKIIDKIALKNTIGHELTHALVNEHFEHIFIDIKDKNADGSPIFLATLQYLGYSSGHYCAHNYIRSKVWMEIDKLKKNNLSWSEFKDYIFFYLANIEDIREKFNKEHHMLGQTISFTFSSRGCGLRKLIDVKEKHLTYIRSKNKLKKLHIAKTMFEIGSMMYPELIKKLILKKLGNDVRADMSCMIYGKSIVDDKTEYKKLLYEKEEVYNKYAEQKVA